MGSPYEPGDVVLATKSLCEFDSIHYRASLTHIRTLSRALDHRGLASLQQRQHVSDYHRPCAETARGLFFLFEGGDRCGKTTQSQLLFDALKEADKPVQYFKFPDTQGESGRIIRDYLDGKRNDNDVDIQTLFCEQRKTLLPEMEALLRKGVNLVVDRYSFSGIAYSHAQSENFDECKLQENGLLEPDVVFFVDCDPEAAAARTSYGDDRYEKLDIQRRVRRTFQRLLTHYSRHGREGWWQRLDASRKSADVLHEEVVAKVMELMQQPPPISYLNFDKVRLNDDDAAAVTR